jgi:hypothetical protein
MLDGTVAAASTPSTWPPRNIPRVGRKPLPVPFLDSPPPVIPIDVGRQLFVDDYLVASSTLKRTAHPAEVHDGNPILVPETPLEREGGMACTFDDGVFFDPSDGLFKMFYIIGYYTGKHSTALAVSRDGVHWERPELDVVPGTNVIVPSEKHYARDNFSPWLDHFASDPAERWKAYLYLWPREGGEWGHTLDKERPEWLLTSPDGVHWNRRKKFLASSGDCTSLFHDPFRQKWVLNIRSYLSHGRDRCYYESDDFLGLANVTPENRAYWLRADDLDLPDPDVVRLRRTLKPEEMERISKGAKPEHLDRWFGDPTQLYTIAPTPYESLMLGVFTIHYGPENCVLEKRDDRQPKLTQIKLGYSRDGFHYARPDRDVFIAASKKAGCADRGYVRAAGGGCLVVGDKLHFYYSAASGVAPDGQRHLYAGGCMHLATLRRDGFVSLDAGREAGFVTTRPVTFSGRALFVNVKAASGRLRVAVLDTDNNHIEPFTLENCIGLCTDETAVRVTWRGGNDLSLLAQRPVRLLFELTNGSLYSFWVSPDESGASRGYLGAGSPGHTTGMDIEGKVADHHRSTR